MQLWTIFQDLHQLHAAYGRTAETFLSNAGIVQAFNVNDVDTARWVSGRCLVPPCPIVAGRPAGPVGRS